MMRDRYDWTKVKKDLKAIYVEGNLTCDYIAKAQTMPSVPAIHTKLGPFEKIKKAFDNGNAIVDKETDNFCSDCVYHPATCGKVKAECLKEADLWKDLQDESYRIEALKGW